MNFLTEIELETLQAFRKLLHKYPELSGEEKETAEKLEMFISNFNPDKIIKNIGGNGIAFIFGKEHNVPTVMFRADMDALPINEINKFDHKSIHENISHKCGHDGHMAILCGIAIHLFRNPPKKIKVILLFQPEEENGQGAAKVIKDNKFKKLKPDFIFALHNLPGFKKNSIVLSKKNFASASTGLIIDLKGRSSHAAHPEQGNSPAKMTAELILELENLPKKANLFNDFTLITVIYSKIGDIAFGTNPGKSSLMATLRSFRNDDMEKMQSTVEEIINKKAKQYNIEHSIEYTEHFPATTNNIEAIKILESAAKKTKYPKMWIEEPFRWSEDFGNFAMEYKTALWGLGSGTNHPKLHNNDYDFPDDIIEAGVNVFINIIEEIVESK